jgi:hypothetical protein
VAATKRFTLAEANALIPRLELLMERMQRTARALRSALQETADGEAPPARTTAEALRVRPDLADRVREIESLVAEIEELGCDFKGLELGLVDFPAEIDGAPVLLCWQYGEKQIAYWHPVDEGFAGRRALRTAARPPLQ